MDEESDINNLLQLNLGIDDSNLVKMNEIKEECVYQTTLDKYEFIKTFSVLHMNVRQCSIITFQLGVGMTIYDSILMQDERKTWSKS